MQVADKLITCEKCGYTGFLPDTLVVQNLMDDIHGYGNCIKCKHRQPLNKKKEEEVVEQLYTPKDVKRVRDEFVKKQGGIDPILKEPFKEVAVLDHCHHSQHVRAALNRNCNAFEGKVVNAYIRCLKWLTDRPLPEILRNLADYYEDQERVMHLNPLHPGWIKKTCTEFGKLNEAGKKSVLQSLGSPEGVNATERKKFFRKAVLSKKFTYEGLMKEIKERSKV